jgi:hypothetical protein
MGDKIPDFSGYATKNGLMCSDGRTIMTDAFKHNDTMRVPLVWQHLHNEPVNILGHALLENRPDGVYTYGFFNDTDVAKIAKESVRHGDITALSIYANNLQQKGKQVFHGDIKEVSLVLAGANPGAFIDSVNLAHSDGTDIEDEAIIYTGLSFEHADTKEGDDVTTNTVIHAEDTPKTVKEVWDTLTEEQSTVVSAIIAEALETVPEATEGEELQQSALDSATITTTITDDVIQHVDKSIKEGFQNMTRNAFEENETVKDKRPSLSHSQMTTIVNDGNKYGKLSDSFIAHAGEYGIDDIEFLFPDAKTLSNTPEFISRRMEWVTKVLGGVRKSPISRVKSIVADITADEARAKGYVKGSLKKDEVIKLLKRVTQPKTIYKKQKLDRDDIIDITDIDVVTWLKMEMRIMLDEEVAAAILVGDGRESDDEDKIDEDHLRPIAYDVDMYNTTVYLDGTPTPAETTEAIIRSLDNYKGSGAPAMYTTQSKLTDLLLDKDTLGRRYYATKSELAAALGVSEIVVVEAMSRAADVVAVIVNLIDYTVGADKGGEINFFDDFDIDYNQNKYLIETRISGALTKPKSSITIRSNPGIVLTTVNAPTFVNSTGVLTIPTQTGVSYLNGLTNVVLAAGAQPAIVSGASIIVEAVATAGYSFVHGLDTDWSFTRV